jgi:hypothetical protein
VSRSEEGVPLIQRRQLPTPTRADRSRASGARDLNAPMRRLSSRGSGTRFA